MRPWASMMCSWRWSRPGSGSGQRVHDRLRRLAGAQPGHAVRRIHRVDQRLGGQRGDAALDMDARARRRQRTGRRRRRRARRSRVADEEREGHGAILPPGCELRQGRGAAIPASMLRPFRPACLLPHRPAGCGRAAASRPAVAARAPSPRPSGARDRARPAARDRPGRERAARPAHRLAPALALDGHRRGDRHLLPQQGRSDRRRPGAAGARGRLDRRRLHAGEPACIIRPRSARSSRRSTRRQHRLCRALPARLYAKLRDWAEAAAAYHSFTPTLGEPYGSLCSRSGPAPRCRPSPCRPATRSSASPAVPRCDCSAKPAAPAAACSVF